MTLPHLPEFNTPQSSVFRKWPGILTRSSKNSTVLRDKPKEASKTGEAPAYRHNEAFQNRANGQAPAPPPGVRSGLRLK